MKQKQLPSSRCLHPAGPVFVIAGLRCEVHLTKRQKRRVEKMYEPYSPMSVKWDAFAKELEKTGAEDVESYGYAMIAYFAKDEAIGRAIAVKAIELLNKPIQPKPFGIMS